MTNIQWIRSMSDRELAILLSYPMADYCKDSNCEGYLECEHCVMEWLREEHEGELNDYIDS